MDNETLAKYQYYIETITNEIHSLFEYQKEYICCKEGCSGCCEHGEYPFSELEFEYLKLGYLTLPYETRLEVEKNIKELVETYKKEKNNSEHFLHKCPFLVNGSCCVYKYRGIICRTFGLITENSEGNLTVPFCSSEGLNYSKVYDEKNKKIISEEEIVALGYKVMPKPYNLSRNNLMNLSLVKKLELNFGESKTLIDWLVSLIEIK